MLNRDINTESGNIFLMVIVGVVLFSALMFTLSRGMNESPTNISERQAKVSASDILSYAKQIERSVSRILRKGCSQDLISFYSPLWDTPADYDNAANDFSGADAAGDFSCFVFYPGGGKVSFRKSPDGVDQTVFTAANVVEGFGIDTSDSTGTDLIVVHEVAEPVCGAVNDALGLGEPAEEPGTLSLVPFQGDFTHADDITGAAGEAAACVRDTERDGFFVYNVLHVR